jgi:hypothetical protein
MRQMIVHGHRWWTTAAACAQLRVRPHRLRDWVRRSKAAGHTTPADACRRCAAGHGGFPHVDAPTRRGRVAGYRAEQVIEAELYTHESTRGNRRCA